MGKTVNRTSPYGRVWFRGVQLDNRTLSAALWAEKRYRAVAPRKRQAWKFAQGSYNGGGVRASAGTHDGGGSLDIGAADMNPKQIRGTVKWLRKAGFAAWFRPRTMGLWGPHIHAVLLWHRNASKGAKDQWVAYLNGRDGLANNGPDQDWRPVLKRRWNHRKNRPIRKGRL